MLTGPNVLNLGSSKPIFTSWDEYYVRFLEQKVWRGLQREAGIVVHNYSAMRLEAETGGSLQVSLGYIAGSRLV